MDQVVQTDIVSKPINMPVLKSNVAPKLDLNKSKSLQSV
jgi:hypothetical protein